MKRDIQETWRRESLPVFVQEKLNEANVFFSEEWYQYTKARGEKLCYVFNRNYVLEIRVKSVLFLSGGLLDSEPFCLSGEDTLEGQMAFLEAVCRHLKRKQKIHWIQTDTAACFQVYPKGAYTFGTGTYILDLENNSEEELFKLVHSKNRNMIRRGEREGVQLIWDDPETIKDYKWLEDQVWDRSKRGTRPLSYYTTLLKSMPHTSTLLMGYKDGEAQAGGLFLFNKAMGYYFHGASKDHPTPGAHNYLIWKEILWMKEHGVKMFNFVGYRRKREEDPTSKQYGIQKFKEKFGGSVLETFDFRYTVSPLMFFIYRVANVILYHGNFKDEYEIRSKHFPEYNTSGLVISKK